jgi:hypothetical protein
MSAVVFDRLSMFVCLFQHCGGDRPYIHPNQLDVLHQEVRRQALEKFTCARKMGGEQMSLTYQQDLDDELQENYGKSLTPFIVD